MNDTQTRWAQAINHLERVAILQELAVSGPVSIHDVDLDNDEDRFERAGRDTGLTPVYIGEAIGFAINAEDLDEREMSNEYDVNDNCLRGMRCPVCGSTGPFDIVVSKKVTVYDSGTDDNGGDTEWENSSGCSCCECEHEGIVLDFRESPIVSMPEPVTVLMFASQDDGYELRVVVPAGVDINQIKQRVAVWLDDARAIYRKDGDVKSGPFLDGTNDYKETDILLFLAGLGCIPINEEPAGVFWD